MIDDQKNPQEPTRLYEKAKKAAATGVAAAANAAATSTRSSSSIKSRLTRLKTIGIEETLQQQLASPRGSELSIQQYNRAGDVFSIVSRSSRQSNRTNQISHRSHSPPVVVVVAEHVSRERFSQPQQYHQPHAINSQSNNTNATQKRSISTQRSLPHQQNPIILPKIKKNSSVVTSFLQSNAKTQSTDSQQQRSKSELRSNRLRHTGEQLLQPGIGNMMLNSVQKGSRGVIENKVPDNLRPSMIETELIIDDRFALDETPRASRCTNYSHYILGTSNNQTSSQKSQITQDSSANNNNSSTTNNNYANSPALNTNNNNLSINRTSVSPEMNRQLSKMESLKQLLNKHQSHVQPSNMICYLRTDPDESEIIENREQNYGQQEALSNQFSFAGATATDANSGDTQNEFLQITIPKRQKTPAAVRRSNSEMSNRLTPSSKQHSNERDNLRQQQNKQQQQQVQQRKSQQLQLQEIIGSQQESKLSNNKSKEQQSIRNKVSSSKIPLNSNTTTVVKQKPIRQEINESPRLPTSDSFSVQQIEERLLFLQQNLSKRNNQPTSRYPHNDFSSKKIKAVPSIRCKTEDLDFDNLRSFQQEQSEILSTPFGAGSVDSTSSKLKGTQLSMTPISQIGESSNSGERMQQSSEMINRMKNRKIPESIYSYHLPDFNHRRVKTLGDDELLSYENTPSYNIVEHDEDDETGEMLNNEYHLLSSQSQSIRNGFNGFVGSEQVFAKQRQRSIEFALKSSGKTLVEQTIEKKSLTQRGVHAMGSHTDRTSLDQVLLTERYNNEQTLTQRNLKESSSLSLSKKQKLRGVSNLLFGQLQLDKSIAKEMEQEIEPEQIPVKSMVSGENQGQKFMQVGQETFGTQGCGVNAETKNKLECAVESVSDQSFQERSIDEAVDFMPSTATLVKSEAIQEVMPFEASERRFQVNVFEKVRVKEGNNKEFITQKGTPIEYDEGKISRNSEFDQNRKQTDFDSTVQNTNNTTRSENEVTFMKEKGGIRPEEENPQLVGKKSQQQTLTLTPVKKNQDRNKSESQIKTKQSYLNSNSKKPPRSPASIGNSIQSSR